MYHHSYLSLLNLRIPWTHTITTQTTLPLVDCLMVATRYAASPLFSPIHHSSLQPNHSLTHSLSFTNSLNHSYLVYLSDHGDFFKLAFERSRGAIVVSREEPFTILELNAKAAKTCNIDANVARGAPLFSALPVFDHHAVRELLELSKDNPQAAVLTINNKSIRVRTHLVVGV